MSNETYIVAYSFTDRFEIPAKVASALMDAKEKNLGGVRYQDQFFAASFQWVQPKSKTSLKELDNEQMKMALKVATWLGDPVHDLGWSYHQAWNYSQKLLRRASLSDVKQIWQHFGMGAYPSAKGFLSSAKELAPEVETGLAVVE